jgi:hypothetical protein
MNGKAYCTFSLYSFALVACAFFRIGSILVAFMTSPLTFNFPDMNNRCAFALPATNLPKSSSERERVTIKQIHQPQILNSREGIRVR